MMIGGALTNALVFSGSSFLFSQMSSAEERKRHNLAMEELQYDRDSWNEQRLARIDYINQKLKEEGHAERTFASVDEAMREYNMLTGGSAPMPPGYAEMAPEPQLEDYLTEDQVSALQTGELVIVGAGMLLTGYLVYKYVYKNIYYIYIQ